MWGKKRYIFVHLVLKRYILGKKRYICEGKKVHLGKNIYPCARHVEGPVSYSFGILTDLSKDGSNHTSSQLIVGDLLLVYSYISKVTHGDYYLVYISRRHKL